MPDYSKGQIYIIRNHVDDRVYIGSTTQTLAQRMREHRSCAKKNHFKLYKAFAELGVDKFYIERLEEFPCNDVQALVSREGYYIRLYDSFNAGLNGKISGGTLNFAERYASDPEFREKTLERNRKYKADKYATDAEFLEKNRDYNRKYMTTRYAMDADFREKQKIYCKEYYAKKKTQAQNEGTSSTDLAYLSADEPAQEHDAANEK